MEEDVCEQLRHLDRIGRRAGRLEGVEEDSLPGRLPRSSSATNGYSLPMTDLPARELRNDVSGVLRRVEAGETLRVTVNGRPVAELVPLRARPRTMTWEEFHRHFDGGRADQGLAQDLATLVPDCTDDAPVR